MTRLAHAALGFTSELWEITYRHAVNSTTTVYLLTGHPGSGKTTYAKDLERRGVVRLAVDEEVIARHGRFGVDYPAHEHLDRQRPVLDDIGERLIDLVRSGRDVVLDHGLGRRSDRDHYKAVAEAHGATWQLLHFVVDHDELFHRVALRNELENGSPMSPETLAWIIENSEDPIDEGQVTMRAGNDEDDAE